MDYKSKTYVNNFLEVSTKYIVHNTVFKIEKVRVTSFVTMKPCAPTRNVFPYCYLLKKRHASLYGCRNICLFTTMKKN